MEEFLTKNSKLLVISLTGLILIGSGVLVYKTGWNFTGDKVEVLNSTTENNNAGPDSHQDIVVEISGSVEKAGVYKLQDGARMNDLIIAAGGISADSDRDWIEKNVNKAAKLRDGQKLYIYHLGEVSAKTSDGIKLDQEVLGSFSDSNETTVNINTSSQLELEKLNGIGPVYATNIIEHRPYSTAEELVSKGAISKKIFEKIKGEITIR